MTEPGRNDLRTAPLDAGSRLAPTERELVRRARGLLTSKIALAQNVAVADAEASVDQQLAVKLSS